MEIDRERQLSLLLISGIVLVVIITVLVLIRIWTKPNKKEEITTYEVGKINITKNISQEDYVKRYFSQLANYMRNANYDELYKLVGEDYKSYKNLTKEGLIDYLKVQNVIGQILELKTYERASINGYNNVYTLNLKQKEGIYDINIVVREISPNVYTIAFDGFLSSENISYNTTVDSVNLSINKVTCYSNSVEFDVTIKNTSINKIDLNKNYKLEGILLKISDGSIVYPENTILGGTTKTIDQNRSFNCKLIYNVNNSLMSSMNSLILADVYYYGRGITKNIEFKL